jgi:ParB family chromosome partitioning protein
MLDQSIDPEAIAIGLLYRKMQTQTDDRIFYFAEVGNRLLAKKETTGHGHWLHWIRVNQGALGFSDKGARDLIQGAQWMASNWRLAARLEELVTDPSPTEKDILAADQIRQLISGELFRPVHRGTLGRRGNEWYTPREYISLARAVMGDIDVDPASTELAQQTVKAGQYFNEDQNGLRQNWYGRVWLNPPYSRVLIRKFVGKLLVEWNARRITEAIALTHNFTDAMWFHDAVSAADIVCFTQGRIKFNHPGGTMSKPPHGQAFFYFGPNVDGFKREFGRVGSIVRPEPDSWSRQPVRVSA